MDEFVPKRYPGYVYQPYPKWVDGKIVKTKEEHDALLISKDVLLISKDVPVPTKKKKLKFDME